MAVRLLATVGVEVRVSIVRVVSELLLRLHVQEFEGGIESVASSDRDFVRDTREAETLHVSELLSVPVERSVTEFVPEREASFDPMVRVKLRVLLLEQDVVTSSDEVSDAEDVCVPTGPLRELDRDSSAVTIGVIVTVKVAECERLLD